MGRQRFLRVGLACAAAGAGVLALAAGLTALAQPKASQGTAAAVTEARTPRFPDFGQLPPPNAFTPDRTFKLSQDFPQTLPPIDADAQKILAIDFTRDWRAYADAVLDYILEGNIEDRPVSDAFYLEDNKVRRWYHVPWQHWGDNGREGLHGLTSEGPVYPFTLSPAQKNLWQTYAVGFYNDRGGYLMGRVWADAESPRLDVVQKEGGFPVGTIVGKVLFTTTPVSEAPFLSNPIEWNAYTKLKFNAPGPSGLPITPRQMSTVRLIQVDFMVRDDRAKATGGWVFGTYVYNGARAQANLWRNLVPVGIMWGNDPTVLTDFGGNPAPTKTLINKQLKETVINPDARELPPMHLGFGLRLSGPVDNTLSSCKSCHSTSEFPSISPIMAWMDTNDDGKPLTCKDKKWMDWFRNLAPTETFDKGAWPTDNSLQLAASVQNFLTARGLQDGGLYSVQYWKGRPLPPVSGQRGGMPTGKYPCDNPPKG